MGAQLTYEHCYPETQDTQLTTLQKILQCGSGSSGSGGSGGTVGCGCYIQGHGIPSAAPTLPTVPYYYTNLDDGVGFYWDVELQAWA